MILSKELSQVLKYLICGDLKLDMSKTINIPQKLLKVLTVTTINLISPKQSTRNSQNNQMDIELFSRNFSGQIEVEKKTG